MEKMTFEMIKCNLNPLYEIPLRDAGFYHLRGEKTNINPSDPIHPQVFYRVFPVRTEDYKRFFSPTIGGEKQVLYMKAANFTALELVHDPTLLTAKEKMVKPEPKSAELIHRESKMKMSKGDVLKLLEEKKTSEE